MAFSGNQTTALGSMALPGKVRTFSAKTEAEVVTQVGIVVRVPDMRLTCRIKDQRHDVRIQGMK